MKVFYLLNNVSMLEEKKKETDVCLNCGTFQLNEKVRGLVDKLFGGKKVVEKPVVVTERPQDGVMYKRRGSDGEFEWVRNRNGMKLIWNWNWSDMSWIDMIWIWIESNQIELNWIELNWTWIDLIWNWVELNYIESNCN